MVKPELVAGGVFLLFIIVVVVWGYFFTKPKFWGLFSKEFDDCTSNTVYISNASTYQLDSDKKCILVKTCATGYKPNSSNTACVSTVVKKKEEVVSTGGGGTPPPPPPPPPGASETVNVPFGNKGIPESEPKWWQGGLKDQYALQYAKIGDNWGSSKCNGAYVPMKPLEPTDIRRKRCVSVNDNTYCKNEKIDNAKTDGVVPGVFGTCGASECISGYVPYDGKCERKTSENPDRRLLVKPGSKFYNDKIGGQPGVAMIPVDEIQPDYSCTQMCANTGMSKSGKSFKSLLPSKWPGSYIFSTNPTSRFWNHSIDEIATKPAIWDIKILDLFKEFLIEKKSIDLEVKLSNGSEARNGYASGYKDLPKEYKSDEDNNDPPGKSNRNKALKVLYEKYEDETDFKTNWNKYLLDRANCYCQGTSKSEYAW